VIRASGCSDEEAFFWSSHGEAELDLLLVRGFHKRGFEIKYTSRPTLTRSMRLAMDDLGLETLDIVFPGDETFPLADGVTAVGLVRLVEQLAGGARTNREAEQ
jgi:predicted AAA+ superfamily ATPase